MELTPLVAGRLAARRRGNRATLVTFAVCLAVVTAGSIIDQRGRDAAGPDNTDVRGLIWFIASNLTLIFGVCVGFWLQRRVERGFERTTLTRSAHPVSASAVAVLGRQHAVAIAVVYSAGLTIGGAVALFGPQQADRSLALAFLVGTALLAALNFTVLTNVLRRPALAEDAESLRTVDPVAMAAR